jgi:hypothetical protein
LQAHQFCLSDIPSFSWNAHWFPALHCSGRYSDWLQAGRSRGWSSIPGRVKNFLFFTSSRTTLYSTQAPSQWEPGFFPRGLSGRGVKLILTALISIISTANRMNNVPSSARPLLRNRASATLYRYRNPSAGGRDEKVRQAGGGGDGNGSVLSS